MHVRWMIRRDLTEVLAIEGPEGWSEEDFLLHLRMRDTIGMVGEVGEAVVSFMVYRLTKRRLNVLRMGALDHDQAIPVMVAKLKSKLSSHRRQSITVEAEVGSPLLPLLAAEGFRALSLDGDTVTMAFVISAREREDNLVGEVA